MSCLIEKLSNSFDIFNGFFLFYFNYIITNFRTLTNWHKKPHKCKRSTLISGVCRNFCCSIFEPLLRRKIWMELYKLIASRFISHTSINRMNLVSRQCFPARSSMTELNTSLWFAQVKKWKYFTGDRTHNHRIHS